VTAQQSTEVVMQTGTEVVQLLVVRHATQVGREASSFCWAGGAGGVEHIRAFLGQRVSTAPASTASSASPVHRDGAVWPRWIPGAPRLAEGVKRGSLAMHF